MMKKVWITDIGRDLASISFESEKAERLEGRLYVNENIFPANPTPKYPLRHTINIGTFSTTDLVEIRDKINEYLERIGYEE